MAFSAYCSLLPSLFLLIVVGSLIPHAGTHIKHGGQYSNRMKMSLNNDHMVLSWILPGLFPCDHSLPPALEVYDHLQSVLIQRLLLTAMLEHSL